MNAPAIDLDAYFERIGYDGPRDNALSTLRRLHELHPRAIPFENLDPLLGRPVRLDLASIQDKLVQGGRGGYCFEQNSLMAAVLRTLGFAVKEATGRVRWGMAPEVRMPRTHCLLIVEAEGDRYLADVGFGGNTLTGPLKLETRDAQATPHEQFRLVDEDNGIVAQEARIGGQWMQTYAFDFTEAYPADFEIGSWYTSAHPQSLFVNGLMAARAEKDRRFGLRDNQLAVHTLGGTTDKTTLKSAGELRDALTDLFKLRLEGLSGLDDKLARLAEKTS